MNKYSFITLLLIVTLPILQSFNTPEKAKQTPQGDSPSSVKKGQTVYTTYCIACHQENGKGMEGAFPPLAGSDYLKADTKRAIKVVMKGLSGEIIVNEKKYNGAMPDFGLNDEQVADVVNYINNSWGNKGKLVTVDDAKAVRAANK